MSKQLVEGKDFYFNDNGLMVFTEAYHLAKGFCCGNGCLHCPYDYQNVLEPIRSELLRIRNNETNENNSAT